MTDENIKGLFKWLFFLIVISTIIYYGLPIFKLLGYFFQNVVNGNMNLSDFKKLFWENGGYELIVKEFWAPLVNLIQRLSH